VSSEDNKRVVADFVERCQNQHDLAAADEIIHPDFVNHYAPEGRPHAPTPRPAPPRRGLPGVLRAPAAGVPGRHDGDQRAARGAGPGGHPQDPAGDPPRGALRPAADRQPGRVGVHRHLPRAGGQARGALDPHGLRGPARTDAPPHRRRRALTRQRRRRVDPAPTLTGRPGTTGHPGASTAARSIGEASRTGCCAPESVGSAQQTRLSAVVAPAPASPLFVAVARFRLGTTLGEDASGRARTRSGRGHKRHQINTHCCAGRPAVFTGIGSNRP
jgi:hypothetical protein